MFVGTLADNLRLARRGRRRRALVAALAAVDADGWALALPDGLATRVGSGGLGLSPAQAQQVALARLVLADPHTLVLDEATSLLDRGAARSLERSLGRVLEGRTVVAVAHRLHTAHDADRVAVVDGGRVTELGTHDELLAADGDYAALWHAWQADARTGTPDVVTAGGGRRALGVGRAGAAGALARRLRRAARRGGAPTARCCGPPTGRPPRSQVPFPPLTGDLVAHALADRRVGILLVRLGGHAVGVAEGARLVVSKVGSRQVHGRSAAGGWSQQRFARRREGQVRVAHAAATQTAVDVLLPHARRWTRVVVGGERTSVDAVLADRRLAALVPLVTGRFLDVPDPRQKVLETVPAMLREVQIRVVDP